MIETNYKAALVLPWLWREVLGKIALEVELFPFVSNSLRG